LRDSLRKHSQNPPFPLVLLPCDEACPICCEPPQGPALARFDLNERGRIAPVIQFAFVFIFLTEIRTTLAAAHCVEPWGLHSLSLSHGLFLVQSRWVKTKSRVGLPTTYKHRLTNGHQFFRFILVWSFVAPVFFLSFESSLIVLAKLGSGFPLVVCLSLRHSWVSPAEVILRTVFFCCTILATNYSHTPLYVKEARQRPTTFPENRCL